MHLYVDRRKPTFFQDKKITDITTGFTKPNRKTCGNISNLTLALQSLDFFVLKKCRLPAINVSAYMLCVYLIICSGTHF
jgi:hypothetical protein